MIVAVEVEVGGMGVDIGMSVCVGAGESEMVGAAEVVREVRLSRMVVEVGEITAVEVAVEDRPVVDEQAVIKIARPARIRKRIRLHLEAGIMSPLHPNNE